MYLAYVGISLKASINGIFTCSCLKFSRHFLKLASSLCFCNLCGKGGVDLSTVNLCYSTTSFSNFSLYIGSGIGFDDVGYGIGVSLCGKVVEAYTGLQALLLETLQFPIDFLFKGSYRQLPSISQCYCHYLLQ
ncbi:hypothetical protein HAX54_022688, partial [Datura stramonium]|nr:hypothetical protein [Datura stramonium]